MSAPGRYDNQRARIGCVNTPCGWERPIGCACRACGPTDDVLYDEMWDTAVEWLYDETCNRFPGACQVIARICKNGCECECECYHGCTADRVIDLHDLFCYPVLTDTAGQPCLTIVENGTPWVYGTDYWLSDGWTLHACRPWPKQTICNPPGTDGTWEIVATIGQLPPNLVKRAAADLACELVKACKGEDTCLPDGVRSISRRGVTMDVEETVTFDGERTGIATVDMVVGRYGCRSGDVWDIYLPLPWRVIAHQGPYPVAIPACVVV